MSAPSLYRRHRPRTFEDVVGQEHVVRTLRNAIAQDRVHHAYLFVGSRGTGKTSMAKMLAACLNCEGRDASPTVEPCGACEPCVSIAAATSMDVVEMDAASNNSVDDIRELRDAVAYAPVGGHHKVYILDEAHMLSSAAWNAFLKTLEEPPARTIFVLATTEANKVLPTVADRCHRFDFHRPTPEQLARVIGRVAEREGIAIDAEASALVGRHATGSYRDALGTLEQLVTYTGGRIETDDVLAVLGVADGEVLLGAFDAIARGDAASALRAAEAAARGGRDLGQVLTDLEAHARALLVVLTLGGELPDELRLSPERDRRTEEQAGRVGGAAVVRVLDLIAGALRAIHDGADPRTQLELVLVRAAAPEIDPQARALTARIERLERQLADAGRPVPATAAGAAAAPEISAPAGGAASGAGGDRPGAGTGATPPPAASPPAISPPAASPPAARADGAAAAPAPRALSDRAADATDERAGTRQAAAGSSASGPSDVPSWMRDPGGEGSVPSGGGAAAPPTRAASSAPAQGPAPSAAATGAAIRHAPAPMPESGAGAAPGVDPRDARAPAADLDLQLVRDVLPAVREAVSRRGLVSEALRGAEALAVRDGDLVVLGIPTDAAFAASSLRDGTGREAVLDALAELLGSRPRLEVELHATAAPVDAPLPEEEAVRRVLQEFDAREVDAAAPPVPEPSDDEPEGGAS